jgi:hypothetical protein
MISVPSALLCTSLPELADGETLCELSRELYRQLRRSGAGPAGSFSNRSDGPEDVPACLQFFVDAFGYEALPRLLTDVRCAERIALAHVPTIAAFVCFLRDRIGETELLLQRSGGGGGNEEISSASSRSGNYGHNPIYFTSAAATGVRAQRASSSSSSSSGSASQTQSSSHVNNADPIRQKRVDQVASALLGSSSSSSSSYFPVDNADSQMFQQPSQTEQEQPQTPIRKNITVEENAKRLRAAAEAALKEVRESSSSAASASSASLQQLPLVKPVFLENRRGSAVSNSTAPLVSHPKAWNASTMEEVAPREKSAIYVRQMSVMQLSPARAKANAKAAAAVATTVNSNDSNAVPSFGGVGLRVGTIADPTYVPRIALPVGARKSNHNQQLSVKSPPPSQVVAPPESLKKGSRTENPPEEQRSQKQETSTIQQPPSKQIPAMNANPPAQQRLMSPLAPAPAPLPKQQQQQPHLTTSTTTDAYTDTNENMHEQILARDDGDIFSQCSSKQRTLLNWMRSAHGIEIVPEKRLNVLYSISPTMSHHHDNQNVHNDALKPTSTNNSSQLAHFPGHLPNLLKDGLLLGELVCACEEKSGVSRHSGRPTMKVLVKSPGGAKGPAGASTSSSFSSRMRTYLAGTVFPREGAGGTLAPSACSKNLELALDVLRQRPRVNPRFLWSGEEIRRGASLEVAWGLLEDIFKAYGGDSWVSRNAAAPKSFNVAQRLDSAVMMAAAAANAASVEDVVEDLATKKLQSKFEKQLDDVAPPASPKNEAKSLIQPEKQRSMQSPAKYVLSSAGPSTLNASSFTSSSSSSSTVAVPTQDPMPQPAVAAPSSSAAVSAWLEAGGRSNMQSLNTLYNGSRPAALVGRLPILPEPLPVPSCVLSVLPLSSPLHKLHQQYQEKKTHSFVTKNGEMPLWGGLFDRAEAIVSLAGLNAGRISPVTQSMESDVRAWLRELELSGIAPLNEGGVHHVLDNPLYNGCLLVAVARAIEPTLPPLGGDKPLRHFKKTISLGEARANVEAALHVFRCSRLTTLSPPLPPLFNEETGDVIEPPTTPLVYLFCCEELLVANHDAAWGLLWHIFSAQKHALAVAEQSSRVEMLRAKKAAARNSARSGSVTARTISRIGIKGEGGQSNVAIAAAAAADSAASIASESGYSSLNASFSGSVVDGSSASAPPTPGRRFLSNEKDVMLWLSSLGLLKQLGFNDDHIEDAPMTIASITGPLCDGTLIATVVRMILIAAQEQADCDTAALGGVSAVDAAELKVETTARLRALQILKHIDPTPRTELICKANLSKALDALRSGIADRALSVRYVQDVGIVDALFEGRPKETVGLLMDLAAFSKTRGLFTRYSEALRIERKLRLDAENAQAERLAALAAQERNDFLQREAQRLAEIEELRREEEQRQRDEEQRILAEKRAKEAIERRRLAEEQKLQDLEFVSKLQAQSELADDEAHDAKTVTGEHLYKWLTGLGILIRNRADLEIGAETMPEFSDGVHFCNLVEECENMRGNRQPLLGVERFPKTNAAMLSNFARVLERLRDNPNMPLGLLYSEARLRLGEGKATRRLLLQIRRAYGHHLISSNFYEAHSSTHSSLG